jgi:hypothetical protein
VSTPYRSCAAVEGTSPEGRVDQASRSSRPPRARRPVRAREARDQSARRRANARGGDVARRAGSILASVRRCGPPDARPRSSARARAGRASRWTFALAPTTVQAERRSATARMPSHRFSHRRLALRGVRRARLEHKTPRKVEREKGFEPSTSTLARWHSTTELLPRFPAPEGERVLVARTIRRVNETSSPRRWDTMRKR